eukprot:TRINITY_DN20358_c0_g1_i1.p1 TRINITY_DN20358_c0_g1~~TRINITY_DN20358_c0_g1_i1.p1  ORF type:complete len:263 (+),score=80.01 TRINITY_DN20358_c0_g1_i1:32-790(+)
MEVRICLRSLASGAGEGIVEVAESGSVWDLKLAVYDLFGTKPEEQELVLGGENLDDDEELLEDLPLSPWSVVEARETAKQRAQHHLRRCSIAGTPAELLAAVKKGDIPLAASLLEAGVDVNCRSSGRYSAQTPLHCSTERGDYDMSAFLVSHGADLDALDYFGDTPLHNTAKLGDVPLARLLIDSAASLDIRNSTEQTPLMLAVAHDHLCVSSLLLASGCDHTILDSEGSVACHFAKTKEMYRLFPKKGVYQ